MHGLPDNDDEMKFRQMLREFWASKGITQMKIPQIGGQQLDLLKLYRSVCKRGGGQAVSNHKFWKEIVDEFGLPSSCTSASFTLKNHYQKYLLAYEQKYFFGKDDDSELPELMAGRQRKQPKMDESKDYRFGLQRPPGQRQDHQKNAAELEAQLNKQYERVDKNQQITFLKRSKMYPYLSDLKRVQLGLCCGIPSQTLFALNTLLLYSLNTHTPFKLQQYPQILQSLCQFTSHLYPFRSASHLQSLRSITLILRNLCMNSSNLNIIVSSSLNEVLLKILEDNKDRECTKNIIDMATMMIRVGWEPKLIIPKVYVLLGSEKMEEVEVAVDFVRCLVEEGGAMAEGLADLVVMNKDILFSMLLAVNNQTREAATEIIASTSTNPELLAIYSKDYRLQSRLIALMFSGVKNQRTCELAIKALTNIAKDPVGKQTLKSFEQELVLFASTSASLSSSVVSILTELNS